MAVNRHVHVTSRQRNLKSWIPFIAYSPILYLFRVPNNPNRKRHKHESKWKKKKQKDHHFPLVIYWFQNYYAVHELDMLYLVWIYLIKWL